LAVVYTILIFGVIIFVHEFGHFLLCRICGVKVNEFAIGMGPKLLKHQGKRTLYSLRLLPVGGFCAMEGEDASESAVLGAAQSGEDASSGDEAPPAVYYGREQPFYKRSVLRRVLICGAGAGMNLLLGLVLLFSIALPQEQFTSCTIASFREDAPAGISALREGDQILRINGSAVFTANDIPTLLTLSKTGVVDVLVRRDGEKVLLENVDFTVGEKNGQPELALGFYVYPIQRTFLSAVTESVKQTVSTARNSWLSVGALFTGKVGFADLSGPVGVGKYVGEAARYGLSTLLNLAAFISISVGMFNLLPFPALDGGRILFLLIEAVRRKPLNPKWESYINAAGLVLLLVLMAAVTFKDILGLF